MNRSFSLYPPIVAFLALVLGIGLVSVPAALIVGGALFLAIWFAYFLHHVRTAKS